MKHCNICPNLLGACVSQVESHVHGRRQGQLEREVHELHDFGNAKGTKGNICNFSNFYISSHLNIIQHHSTSLNLRFGSFSVPSGSAGCERSDRHDPVRQCQQCQQCQQWQRCHDMKTFADTLKWHSADTQRFSNFCRITVTQPTQPWWPWYGSQLPIWFVEDCLGTFRNHNVYHNVYDNVFFTK